MDKQFLDILEDIFLAICQSPHILHRSKEDLAKKIQNLKNKGTDKPGKFTSIDLVDREIVKDENNTNSLRGGRKT